MSEVDEKQEIKLQQPNCRIEPKQMIFYSDFPCMIFGNDHHIHFATMVPTDAITFGYCLCIVI